MKKELEIGYISDTIDYYEYLNFSDDEYLESHRRHYEFRYCWFNHIGLSDYIFDKCYFIDCQFDYCDISNIEFRECVFKNCQFVNCKMMGTLWNDCLFDHCRINECLCRFISIGDSEMRSCFFYECDFNQGSFLRVSLKKTEFDKCNFELCEVNETSLKNIDLSSCKLDYIVTDIKNIYGAIIEPYQALSLLHLLKVKIKGTQ